MILQDAESLVETPEERIRTAQVSAHNNRRGRNIMGGGKMDKRRRRPRLQIVGSGRRLTREEVLGLHDRIVRIHNLMRDRMAGDGGGDVALTDLAEETERHLQGMSGLLFRLLLRAEESADGVAAEGPLGQEDLREFNDHFRFLRRLFPFI